MSDWINKEIENLINKHGRNLYDIIEGLNVFINPLPAESVILNKIGACYMRNGDNKMIWYSSNLINKDFAIAHELGHMILHDSFSDYCYYNPLENKGKQEKEADYFATKLLYNDFEIEDGLITVNDVANRLMIKESCVNYLFDM